MHTTKTKKVCKEKQDIPNEFVILFCNIAAIAVFLRPRPKGLTWSQTGRTDIPEVDARPWLFRRMDAVVDVAGDDDGSDVVVAAIHLSSASPTMHSNTTSRLLASFQPVHT